TYYMVGLLGFGAMGAVISGGARIAVDRASGWNRQLRLTPLQPRVYLAAKVIVGYVSALLSMALMYVCGISFGAHASLVHWVAMTALILVGLAPFAAIGVFVGHVAK
ncbi:hypothetical protein, partial [Acinetobacter baumannii]|uniref:hypothetical protein n=1 Tax=Acinetobacter baumannii TaxID=470 RepID=UPI001BB46808